MATKTNQFVEDLDDLKPAAHAKVPAPAPTAPTQPQQTNPVNTPAPAPVQPMVTASAMTAAPEEEDDDASTGKGKNTAKQNVDDYDVSFGDEKLMSKSDGLDILRPEKGRTVRFALLTNYIPAKRAFNHYIEKKGTYHCLSPEAKDGVCCQKLGESQPQIVALVLHYTNANSKTGRYEKVDGQFPPIEWGIQYIRMSRSAFRRISALVEEDGQPTDIDIVMNHRDSGIGYEYSKVSPARWKKNPELVKEVEAATKIFITDGGKKLLSKLGKRISLLEFRAVLAGVNPSDDADLSVVDDI
jgi:hypothetical protein